MAVKIMPAGHAAGVVKALGLDPMGVGYAYSVNALKVFDESVTQDDLDAAYAAYDHLATVKAEEVAKIKRAAYAHIVSHVPEWKQRNLGSRGTEFLDKRLSGGTLTQAEEAEQTAIKAIWTWVKSVRAYSDGLEADVVAAETEAAARAVLAGASWPAYSVE